MNGDNGWIKIHRQILENPSLMRGDYLAVWMYILLSVNHTETKELLAGKTITVKPGQGIFSTLKASSVLHISVSKIRRILKFFENEHQIEQQKTTKGTVITVLNWDRYQQREHQNEHQVNINCTSSEHQVNNLPYLKKNGKNVKNGKKEYGSYQNVILTDEEFQKLKTEFPDYQMRIDRLSEYMESTGKKYKSHLATIRSWARRDKEKANGTNMAGQSVRKEPSVEDYERVIREAEERRKAGTMGTVPVGGSVPNKGVRTAYPWQRKSTV